MGSPKNFREIFKSLPKQRQKTAIYAPLPPQPPAKTISSAQKALQEQQYKEMWEFVNSERCPCCGAQLDGGISYERANVYCSTNGEEEYKAVYVYGLKIAQHSRFTIYGSTFAYEVINEFISEDIFRNIVFKIDLSYNKAFQQKLKEKVLSYEGKRLLLDKKLDEQAILKKLKLYQTFS